MASDSNQNKKQIYRAQTALKPLLPRDFLEQNSVREYAQRRYLQFIPGHKIFEKF